MDYRLDHRSDTGIPADHLRLRCQSQYPLQVWFENWYMLQYYLSGCMNIVHTELLLGMVYPMALYMPAR